MPIEARQAHFQAWRSLLNGALLHAWIAFPWALLAWLGAVIAARRWSGMSLILSLSFSLLVAAQGWRLMWRIALKLDDALIARLLLQVEGAEPWAIYPQREEFIRAAHLSRCSRRWGVNARSSGWEPFCRSWRRDGAFLSICVALAVHPWWLGL